MLGHIDCHGLTDIGRAREANEDQFLIADLMKSMRLRHTSLGLDHQTRIFGETQGMLLLVADGMGGHAAGDRASQLAVDTAVEYVLNTMRWFYRMAPEREELIEEELLDALAQCEERVQTEIKQSPQRAAMGTTLTMAYLMWPRVYVVHVGDSRCYLLRNGELTQVTQDHTLAQQLVEEGSLPEEDALTSRLNHVLWNVVGGTSRGLEPEVYKGSLQLGDTLLLCSDGLTGHVTDEEITRILASSTASAQTACRRLVDAANAGGGKDNITVVVAYANEGESDEPAGVLDAAETAPPLPAGDETAIYKEGP